MINLKKHTIGQDSLLIEALKKLNSVPHNLTLFVLGDRGEMIGTVTDGDIRRGLILGLPVSGRVKDFMTRSFSYLPDNSYDPVVIRKIKEKGIKLLPVLNKSGAISRVIDLSILKTVLPVDAILMAGGNGERLLPLTEKLPKPMLKIGKKPIIEHNIDHLLKYGIDNINISVRYLGHIIEEFLGDGSKKGININFTHEDTPLGTIGAVKEMKGLKSDIVILLNADIFTNVDYEDLYLTFLEEEADMAIATVPYAVDIPYAILGSEDMITVKDLKEKPSFTYYANTGIYMFRKGLIKYIPSGTRFDATDFIQKLIGLKKKIVRFPVTGYWFDIGKPEDYIKAQEFAKHIRF